MANIRPIPQRRPRPRFPRQRSSRPAASLAARRAPPARIAHGLDHGSSHPLLIGAFFQEPLGLATSLAGFGILASGMWMTREGLKAEAAYDARRVARRPRSRASFSAASSPASALRSALSSRAAPRLPVRGSSAWQARSCIG
ncbi:hypothetical protein QWZ10_01165 [Paracoccus cavernae]|uniref:Uncharacterized protein n=1 Tax=Paracoccus cavernae TaxID=1571207 RepID=A0ABT8D4K1_9RHOB|nr:hypothetical protein [Paracoccus cavernae]